MTCILIGQVSILIGEMLFYIINRVDYEINNILKKFLRGEKLRTFQFLANNADRHYTCGRSRDAVALSYNGFGPLFQSVSRCPTPKTQQNIYIRRHKRIF